MLMEANVPRNLLQLEELCPTLIVGLGGMGKRVLTYLRARFERAFGDVPWDRIRLLALDVDTMEEAGTIHPHHVLLRRDEKVELSGVPVRKLVHETRSGQHPPLQRWLHRDIRLTETSLQRGSQGARQLGRLAFLWHAEAGPGSQNLREKLSRSLDSLVVQNNEALHQPLELQVFVIASLAGGFGSGVFIDFAYLLQDILRGRDSLDKKTLVAAFLTTPLFFGSAPQEHLRANTWAALRELDYFTCMAPDGRRTTPKLAYFGKREIPTGEPPYRFVCLIDAVDHLGRVLSHPELMTRLLGEAVFTLSASRIGSEVASRIHKVHTPQDVGIEGVYSTMGLASLVVPIEEIVGIAAARLLETALTEWLHPPEPEAYQQMEQDVERMLEDQTETLYLSLDALIGRLRSSLGDVDQFRLAERNLERSLVDPIQKAAERIRDAFREALARQVPGLVLEEGQGFVFAQRFLEQVRERLEVTEVEARRQREGTQQRLTSAEEALHRAEEAFLALQRQALSLDEAPRPSRLPFERLLKRGGPASLPEAAYACLMAYQTWLKAQIDTAIHNVLHRLIPELILQVRDGLHNLEDFRANLEEILATQVEAHIAAMKDQIAGMDPVREQPLLSNENDLTPRYRGPEDRYWQQAQQAWKESASDDDAFMDWLAMQDSAALFQALIGTARQAWAHLYQVPELHVEVVIQSSGEKPAWYLRALERNAAYSWQTLVSEAVARGETREVITMIGVADPVESVLIRALPDFARGTKTPAVATGDPHRVTMLKIAQGIRYDTLAQRDLYLQDYQRAMERLEPLHVFPDFYLGDAIDEGLERRRTVALAWAYGLIRRTGDTFTLHPASEDLEISPEVLTEQGLFDLLWRVVHDDGLYQRLREWVQRFEISQSREDLLERLGQFVPSVSEWRQLQEGWLAEIIHSEVARYRRQF